eukprot:4590066-Amphidinium_carterae.1
MEVWRQSCHMTNLKACPEEKLLIKGKRNTLSEEWLLESCSWTPLKNVYLAAFSSKFILSRTAADSVALSHFVVSSSQAQIFEAHTTRVPPIVVTDHPRLVVELQSEQIFVHPCRDCPLPNYFLN